MGQGEFRLQHFQNLSTDFRLDVLAHMGYMLRERPLYSVVFLKA